jgi:hypothetical protein
MRDARCAMRTRISSPGVYQCSRSKYLYTAGRVGAAFTQVGSRHRTVVCLVQDTLHHFCVGLHCSERVAAAGPGHDSNAMHPGRSHALQEGGVWAGVHQRDLERPPHLELITQSLYSPHERCDASEIGVTATGEPTITKPDGASQGTVGVTPEENRRVWRRLGLRFEMHWVELAQLNPSGLHESGPSSNSKRMVSLGGPD